MTPTAQTSEPRTEAGRRILRQDYRGNEAYTVTRQDILAIEAEAAALPAAPAGLDVDAMRRAIHELSWCKEDRMHAFAHGDDPEDDELRERFAAAYAEGEPTE